MASVDPKTLADFQDKVVILTLVGPDGGDAIEITGKVEAASEAGLAFKEKGKREVKLVEPKDIIEIADAPTELKKVTQKKLKPVPEIQARQHMADRHGYNRSDLNAMADADAFKFHEELDHSNLGHKHVAEKDAESEGADSEPAADDDA